MNNRETYWIREDGRRIICKSPEFEEIPEIDESGIAARLNLKLSRYHPDVRRRIVENFLDRFIVQYMHDKRQLTKTECIQRMNELGIFSQSDYEQHECGQDIRDKYIGSYRFWGTRIMDLCRNIADKTKQMLQHETQLDPAMPGEFLWNDEAGGE